MGKFPYIEYRADYEDNYGGKDKKRGCDNAKKVFKRNIDAEVAPIVTLNPVPAQAGIIQDQILRCRNKFRMTTLLGECK